MKFQMTDNSIIDVIKVTSLQLVAAGLALTDVKEFLSIISICVAIGYGLWKWRNDVKKANKNKNE